MAKTSPTASRATRETVSFDGPLPFVPGPQSQASDPAYVWVKYAADEVPAIDGLDYVGDDGEGRPLLHAEPAGTRPGLARTRAEAAIVDVDALADAVAVRLRGAGKPLPSGMSMWVGVKDVMRAMDCSRSKASAYLRAAGGRDAGTGQLLRVPVDVWESWARANVIDEGRQRRWARGDRKRPPSTSIGEARSGGAGTTTRTASASEEAPPRRTRRWLGPGSPVGSERPLIPTLKNYSR